MTDGATKVTDLDKTEANKTLAKSFVDDILVNGKMSKLTGYFEGNNYIQHNPQIGDGLSGLGAALEEMGEAAIVKKYDTIHHVLGKDNFVLVSSKGRFGGKPTSFYDLFRVADGKVAEHWVPLRLSRPGRLEEPERQVLGLACFELWPSPVPATAFCSLPGKILSLSVGRLTTTESAKRGRPVRYLRSVQKAKTV
jgi:predicted SnoaL-like aldol condensation-catalyzing enzyme